MRSIAVLCATTCWLNLAGCVVHDHKGPGVKVAVPVVVAVPVRNIALPGKQRKATAKHPLRSNVRRL